MFSLAHSYTQDYQYIYQFPSEASKKSTNEYVLLSVARFICMPVCRVIHLSLYLPLTLFTFCIFIYLNMCELNISQNSCVN